MKLRLLPLLAPLLLLTAQAQPTPTPQPPATLEIVDAYQVTDFAQTGASLFFARYRISDEPGRRVGDLYYFAVEARVNNEDEIVGSSSIRSYRGEGDGNEAYRRGFEQGIVAGLLSAGTVRTLIDANVQRGEIKVAIQPDPAGWPTAPEKTTLVPRRIETGEVRRAVLKILQQVQEDWGLQLVDGDGLTNAGTAYMKIAAPSIIDYTGLGLVEQISPEGRGSFDRANVQGGTLADANWMVDQGFEGLSETTGIPVAFLTTIVFIVGMGAIGFAFRQQLGAAGATALFAMMIVVGGSLGAAMGFIPLASLLLLLGVIGIGGAFIFIRRFMP